MLPSDVVIGSGVMMLGGELVPIQPERSPTSGTWTIRGADFSLEFTPGSSLSGGGTPASRELSAALGSQVVIDGDGYLAGTSVAVYLLPSTPTARTTQQSDGSIFLDDATVQSDGRFTVTVTMPSAINVGNYVVQVNGTATRASERSVNIPLNLYESSQPRAMTEAAFFKARSASYSKNGQAKLRRILAMMPSDSDDVRVDIAAVSGGLSSSEANHRLAVKRGQKLREFLVEQGIQASYRISVTPPKDGRPAESPVYRRSASGKPLSTLIIAFTN